eukprot:UN07063
MFSTSNTYTLVVLGSHGVGKTSLTHRLVQHKRSIRHKDEQWKIIEDNISRMSTNSDLVRIENYRKQLEVDGQCAFLEIVDTNGTGEFKSLEDQSIRSGDGFVIVYAENNVESFDMAVALLKKVRK